MNSYPQNSKNKQHLSTYEIRSKPNHTNHNDISCGNNTYFY